MSQMMKFDVLLKFNEEDSELVRGIEIQTMPTGDFYLSTVLERLEFFGYAMDDSPIVYYYDWKENLYVNCGKPPVPSNLIVPADRIQNQRIVLKLRHFDQPKAAPKTKKEEKALAAASERKYKKNRTIGYICEKVALWKRLYGNGNKSCTSQQAAQLIGISKRTLEDYNALIKYGKIFGFDFTKHQLSKVGVLRSFVKKQKSLKKKVTLANADSLSTDDSLEESLSDTSSEPSIFQSELVKKDSCKNLLSELDIPSFAECKQEDDQDAVFTENFVEQSDELIPSYLAPIAVANNMNVFAEDLFQLQLSN